MAPDQETVGVDPVGGAGNQGYIILLPVNFQSVNLVRLHNQDLVNLIGQGFVQHMEVKEISLFQLLQIRKHPGCCHAGMGRNHSMRALTANGQGCSGHVPRAALQGVLAHAVVDGQQHINSGNLNVAHNAIPGQIQKAVVVQSIQFSGSSAGSQQFIIGLRFRPGRGQLFAVRFLDNLLVLRVHLRLVLLCIIAAHNGIGHQAQP